MVEFRNKIISKFKMQNLIVHEHTNKGICRVSNVGGGFEICLENPRGVKNCTVLEEVEEEKKNKGRREAYY